MRRYADGQWFEYHDAQPARPFCYSTTSLQVGGLSIHFGLPICISAGTRDRRFQKLCLHSPPEKRRSLSLPRSNSVQQFKFVLRNYRMNVTS